MSWYLAKLRYNLPIYQKTAHGQCSSREKGKNINFKLATVTTATVKQNKSATSIPGIVLYSSVRRPLQLVQAAWEPGNKGGIVLYSSVRRPLQLVQAAWEPGNKGGSVVQFSEETPAISESCMGARGQGRPIQGYKHMPSHSHLFLKFSRFLFRLRDW